ncbi:MAG: MFS transporter [Clostridia bacterium]|nr:MFS transporter [Clostridia bacterium]
MQKGYARLKWACYTGNITMAVVACLSPLLFLTFHDLYGVSFSLLGTLVLVNFATQLTVDLIFSFFSHKFNVSATVKAMPMIAVVGFVLFTLAPVIFPASPYVGLLVGTVIFSSASGLNEVLISPVIAAIPAEDPDKEVSKLHAVYAWGAVGVVLFSTLFLFVFGRGNWQWLMAVLTLLPTVAFLLFIGCDIPKMQTPEKTKDVARFLKNKGVWLGVFGIFLGGAAEITMSGWASTYLEETLGLNKIWGDILGVAAFSATLGLGRTLYAKIGKNAPRALCLGSIGAFVCYLLAAFSPFAWVGLIGCAFTGFCVSMLWPGSLIISSAKYPAGGVLVYALMAAGGDLGASLGPQMVGVVTDIATSSPAMIELAAKWGMTSGQLGMRLGLLIGSLFPLLAIIVFGRIWRKDASKNKLPLEQKIKTAD